jgi:hypothetical protein
MSDSLSQNIKTNQSNQGATKVKVAPIPPDRYTSVNGASENGKSGNGVIPESAGARIPISFRPQERNAVGQSPMDALPPAMSASIPNVMADEKPPEPAGETVEQYVQRMRPSKPN